MFLACQQYKLVYTLARKLLTEEGF